jgi:hypothetical protein
MPAFPAYVLLAAAVVLLVPGVRARPAPRSFELAPRSLRLALLGAIVVFAVFPLGIIAAVPQLGDQGKLAVRLGGSLIPVSPAIRLRATQEDGTVRLSWRTRSPASASAFYRVLRIGGPVGGLFCGRQAHAAQDCLLDMQFLAATKAISFSDHPDPGRWTYRVGVAANWLDDERLGDIYVVSTPVTVTIP